MVLTLKSIIFSLTNEQYLKSEVNGASTTCLGEAVYEWLVVLQGSMLHLLIAMLIENLLIISRSSFQDVRYLILELKKVFNDLFSEAVQWVQYQTVLFKLNCDLNFSLDCNWEKHFLDINFLCIHVHVFLNLLVFDLCRQDVVLNLQEIPC